ncbi:gephyrin-like molybdotransferase Glp [Methyloceanibacter sp.]|uniref:molybdopterin molybdotransferase MoeA n=1 Tax=Methyloceanibacter sp. TaxID=1965321 RepID=UPI002D392561|nr:gephyrin-like molybdotransferase Glp [Methyloceanibacter sp.]HZP09910.1 gephyrin-like molybdotransferase Glp [Methyloceanibacter sp.]
MALLAVEEALARVLDGLSPLEAERVAIENAHGRVLAEDLVARLTQPPFDASAMDGYAVRSTDVASLPARLRVVGVAAAGAGFKQRLGWGEAVRIFTGAPVPEGADTIVIQENAEEANGVVTIKEAAPERHIRPRGQDFREGEALLFAGMRLGPRALMLAAAMNHAELLVRRKPKVAILATGDEVAPPGFELGPDQIVSSVPYGLAALIEAEGGEPMRLGIAKDDVESLVTLARSGKAADILVTIGGASVGERDLVARALASEGLKLEFAKIAMRPGKPLLYGRLGVQRVLGFAGNPVSALVSAHVFLRPMLRRLLGRAESKRPLPEALAGMTLKANGERQHYMRAISEWREDGTRIVSPLASQDSALSADLARADCLIVREPLAPELPCGNRVRIIPLDSD